MEKYISEAVIRRLPRYYRKIEEMYEKGVERVSSSQLSEEMGLNASQIRRDFNCFGGFGQQGYGYAVAKLYHELRRIMGMEQPSRCVVIGAGNIGRALINYTGFDGKPFSVAAAFDTDPVRTGQTDRGIAVYPMDELEAYVRENPVDIAVICTPRAFAQSVCDRLADLGIRGVWNFAPVELEGPAWMTIENVNMSDSLLVLSYRMGDGMIE
ncbi:MAG: redox-sensing transcriptional repressor Rex [Clostridia bacterium]|nr:redox-sensing transcriptional repressor Rex [Clostridia bacterium]